MERFLTMKMPDDKDAWGGKPSWSPDGRKIASRRAAALTIWNTSDGEILLNLPSLGHHGGSRARPAWSPDGKWVAADAADSCGSVFGAKTGKVMRFLHGYGCVTGLGSAEDGKTIFVSAAGGPVFAQKIDEEFRPWILDVPPTPCRSKTIAVSHDGRQYATAPHGDDRLRVWNTETGELVASFGPTQDDCWGIAWSCDGRIACSGGGGIALWDLRPSIPEKRLSVDAYVNCVQWSPTGKTLLYGASGHGFFAWEVDTKKAPRKIDDNATKTPVHIAWLRDGSRCALGYDDGDVVLAGRATREKAFADRSSPRRFAGARRRGGRPVGNNWLEWWGYRSFRWPKW